MLPSWSRGGETTSGSTRSSSPGSAPRTTLGGRSVLDRVLVPLNRAATGRFLREGRRKVWHNTRELPAARLAGPQVYAARLAELESLAAARVQDLLAPGQVVLRFAVRGFGVALPPRDRQR